MDEPVSRLTPLQWVIVVIAAIGFAFDSYVLLVLPLIVRPALIELLHVPPNSPTINDWVGIIFYVPAVAGGIFGLLGGYLTDLLGRRRVLVWSILLYAFSALASGYSASVWWLLFWRCGTFVGVCVEFVAAVAWVSELFPNAKQREAIVGYTQVLGSFGGIMVTGMYYLVVTYGDRLPAVRGGHEAWRYTLISGVIPAIPLILIRPFLPESPTWKVKKEAGTLKRPSFTELFDVRFRRTTIVTTMMMAAAFAAAFGAIQQTPRMVPGLPEVRTLPRAAVEQTVSAVQSFQEFGGLTGRFLLAFLAVRIVSRRRLVRMFQVPGLVLIPIVFLIATSDLPLFKWSLFLFGITTIGQLSFWQLSAARLSDVPAGYRRKLRRQRRRTHDRHVRGAADDPTRERDAGHDAVREAGVRGGDCRRQRVRAGPCGELLAAGTIKGRITRVGARG